MRRLHPFLVDFVADFTCPWCHIGMHSLVLAAKLLSEDGGNQPLVRFRPYLLNPATPPEGLDREAHYRTKFPDASLRAAARARLAAVAAEAGLAFDPLLPKRLPATTLAHVLLGHSHHEGRQIACASALYDAYWSRDADLGDVQALEKIGASIGLDPADVSSALADGDRQRAVRSEASAMSAAGISGVPTYIVNERTGFSGALAPERLAAALKHACNHTMENPT